ncbi:UDP-Glycosyltransferase superfamily protein [Wolffia australiana]
MATSSRRERVAVVVLGDIGRSPRMQYHALSLAEQAHLEVDIVANGGTEPHRALLNNSHIHIHLMKSVQLVGLSSLSKSLALLLKALIQFFILVWYLCYKIPRPDAYIVQNPPSVPTLAAVKLASLSRKSKFIVDWHNFGYSLLALSHGRNHVIVRIYFWFERFFGKMADGSFCVTKAMQHELEQNWGIKSTVLYDQPPEFFRPTSLEEKHGLFCRLENDLRCPIGFRDCISVAGNSGNRQGETIFTERMDNVVSLKSSRPALVVSSTSWTPDEDFGMLLEAAIMYDRRVAATLKESDGIVDDQIWADLRDGERRSTYPRILFVITGKGPERERYEGKIRMLKLRRVAFRTLWLPAEDYPLLLGSANLGVCLHTSSSGLDLPMKVVDMFGCGLPVCAVSFSCIEELVKVDKNGVLFSSASELADQLMLLLKGFPDSCDHLSSLREGAMVTGSSRWSTSWQATALPLLNEVIFGIPRQQSSEAAII